MALFGDAGPEAVVPLSLGGGVGTTINVHGSLIVDEGPLMGDAFEARKFAQQIQAELDKLARGA